MKVSQSLTKRRRSVSALVVLLFCICSAVVPTTASAQMVSQITVPLDEYQDSGVSGMASLSAVGNFVQTSLKMNGTQVVGDHPAHIHTGTCDNFDPNPIFPLTTVVLGWVDGEGGSRSLVKDISLRDLLADDYVILVHKSAEELTNYFVCGDISSAALATVQTDSGSDGAVSIAEVNADESGGTTASAQSQVGKARSSGTKATGSDQQMIVGMPVAGSGDSGAFEGNRSYLGVGLGAVALALALGGVIALTKQASQDSITRRLGR